MKIKQIKDLHIAIPAVEGHVIKCQQNCARVQIPLSQISYTSLSKYSHG